MGFRRHVVLTLVTLGLWLLALPAIVLWRRGSKGAAAVWSGAIAVFLIVVGALVGGGEDAAVSAESSTPSETVRALVAPAQTPISEPATSRPQKESSTAAATTAAAAPPPSAPAANAPEAAAPARAPDPAPVAPRTTAGDPSPATEPEPAPEPIPPAPVEPVAPAPEPPAATKYQNCAAMNVDYPHGVGRAGASDHVSDDGSPVTTFEVNDDLYSANTGRDGDNDQIACEQA